MCGARARATSSSEIVERAGSSAIAEPATQNTSARRTDVGVDVARSQLHVRSLRLAVEEDLRILGRRQRGEGERRAQSRFRPDEPHVHAEADELGPDVLPERVVTDLRDDGGAVSEPRRGDGDVGRRAADRLHEPLWLLEPGTGLVGVEVHADATNGDQLQRRSQ